MIKYVRANTEYASDELWGWVCSGNDAALRKYYTDGGRVGTKYRRFNIDHSLIMGAVRNANFDTALMLAKYGETVSADEMWELQKIYEDMTKPYASSAFSESEISKVEDLIDILSGNRGVQKVPEYWYLTKHGLGPGMLPKRVNVVDAVAGDNFDTYVRLDTPLTYEEEQNYEIHPCDNPNKTKEFTTKLNGKSITAQNSVVESLMVCDHCLKDIESHEGHQQSTKEIPLHRLNGKGFDYYGICDWCGEEFPESELNVLV